MSVGLQVISLTQTQNITKHKDRKTQKKTEDRRHRNKRKGENKRKPRTDFPSTNQAPRVSLQSHQKTPTQTSFSHSTETEQPKCQEPIHRVPIRHQESSLQSDQDTFNRITLRLSTQPTPSSPPLCPHTRHQAISATCFVCPRTIQQPFSEMFTIRN